MEQVLMTGGQLLKFLTTLEQKGATPESVQRAIESGVLAYVFDPAANLENRPALRVALELDAEEDIITVDYDQPLEQMIAAGHYTMANGQIRRGYSPVNGKGVVQFEWKIFYFLDRYIFLEEAVKEIRAKDTANPWEPGEIEHLLAFGKKYPDEPREFQIKALGSVVEIFGIGYRLPCLRRGFYHYGSWRSLDLDLLGKGFWGGRCCFLAVRPVKVSGSLTT